MFKMNRWREISWENSCGQNTENPWDDEDEAKKQVEGKNQVEGEDEDGRTLFSGLPVTAARRSGVLFPAAFKEEKSGNRRVSIFGKKEKCSLYRKTAGDCCRADGTRNKGQFETVRQENRKLTIKNFSFCLSNSSDSGFAAVLITEEEAGMDLMKVRRAEPQMIERICSAKQKEWIFKADNAPQNREERLSPAASLRFFQLWTLVEAAYKAQSFEERDSCRSFVLEDLMCSICFPGLAEQYHLRFWSVDLKEKTVKEKTDKWREQAFPQALQSELYFEKLV